MDKNQKKGIRNDLGGKALEGRWTHDIEAKRNQNPASAEGTEDGNVAIDTTLGSINTDPRAQDTSREPIAKNKPELKTAHSAKPASFGELTAESASATGNLEMILDIPITISVELGRTKMVVNELLQLGQGSVVELEKIAGEPMEVYVNNKLLARGEAVVVNDKFGVRLTDILSPTERINTLR